MNKSKGIFFTICLISLAIRCVAQHENEFKELRKPSYKDGLENFYTLVAKNIIYPVEAKRKGIEGVTVISFQVTDLNNIANAQIVNSIGGGCDEEVIRLLKLGNGNWGNQSTENWYEISLAFELNNPGLDKLDDFYKKGNKFFRKNKYQKALPFFNEITKRNPYDSVILLKRGICKNALKDYEGACVDLKRSKTLGNKDAIEKLDDLNCE